jgi:hypothetical protein
MTHHRVQEWPDMPGDGEDGDAIRTPIVGDPDEGPLTGSAH